MKIYLLIISSIILTLDLLASPSVPDRIIFEGDTLSLFEWPLRFHTEYEHVTAQTIFGTHVQCNTWNDVRGYTVLWAINNDSLFLKSIESSEGQIADLRLLFPNKCTGNGVFVDWFSGDLYAPYGKILYSSSWGFERIHEYEKEFKVNNGVISSIRTCDNTNTKFLDCEYKTPKVLQKFIEENIIQNNLPENDSIKRTVYLSILNVNKKGKIDNVRVLKRDNDIELYPYEKEAIRIMKAIPKWEIIYRHGKQEYNYTIPITFN